MVEQASSSAAQLAAGPDGAPMGWRLALRRAAGRLAALAAIAVLSGCASAPPVASLERSVAHAPRPDGLLAAEESRILAQEGLGQSGFVLLEANQEALDWRLAIVDAARHSLDLQYYVWFGDDVGTLLMLRVIDAADRGVRVRILFDDLNTMLRDMAHVELRDGFLASISRHPNIEIRVFNPWRDRSLPGRLIDLAVEFGRLNRRMHNKQMIVDNRVAIIGGRNIADEYFGLNRDFNFHDLDVLGVGPVARQASAVFDRYWNSGWVGTIPAVAGVAAPLTVASRQAEVARLLSKPGLQRAVATRGARQQLFASLPDRLAGGSSSTHADAPTPAQEHRNQVSSALRALMGTARRELLITNAYIIPDPEFIDELSQLSARGVTVRILTNSLSSHDVPAVNSHYQQWRIPILKTGSLLYELRADPMMRSTVVEIPPTRANCVGLHTKALVVDREVAFVGSMNLDPRSEFLNTEMGVVIRSARLAGELARRMDRDMGGENSWKVSLDPGGNLRWRSDAGQLDDQPARNALQWVENFMFRFFPSDLY